LVSWEPMKNRIFYIAAYDIRSPRRLRAALRVVRGYATGGQKSVFECFLTDAEKKALLSQVRSVIDEERDRFLLVKVAGNRKSVAIGIAVPPADPEYFYVA
jgi:CRISPR-associated protein Cas2